MSRRTDPAREFISHRRGLRPTRADGVIARTRPAVLDASPRYGSSTPFLRPGSRITLAVVDHGFGPWLKLNRAIEATPIELGEEVVTLGSSRTWVKLARRDFDHLLALAERQRPGIRTLLLGEAPPEPPTPVVSAEIELLHLFYAAVA